MAKDLLFLNMSQGRVLVPQAACHWLPVLIWGQSCPPEAYINARFFQALNEEWISVLLLKCPPQVPELWDTCLTAFCHPPGVLESPQIWGNLHFYTSLASCHLFSRSYSSFQRTIHLWLSLWSVGSSAPDLSMTLGCYLTKRCKSQPQHPLHFQQRSRYQSYATHKLPALLCLRSNTHKGPWMVRKKAYSLKDMHTWCTMLSAYVINRR